MQCPFCKENDDRVIDTRSVHEGLAIWRRRTCKNCEGRFTTYERIEDSPRKVVKRDQSREDFDRAKIRDGLETACEKRPVSPDEIQDIVDEIEREVFERESQEISTKEIGRMVMERLRTLDDVAYVRFASVYRDFTDASEFIQELESIREN